MLLLSIFLYLSHLSFLTTAVNNITIPGFPTKCGNLTVPYPFGIGTGSGCSIGPWFDITCNTSFNPPKAFLPADLFSFTGNATVHRIEVVDISDEHVRVKNTIATKCYSRTGGVTQNTTSGLVVENSYFTISSERNKVFAVGCDDYAFVSPVSGIEEKNFSSGCLSICSSVEDVPVGSCSDLDLLTERFHGRYN